jgi:hypothetical protein
LPQWQYTIIYIANLILYSCYFIALRLNIKENSINHGNT